VYLDVFFLPIWGLKKGNWHAECLCTPNPFLAQISRIFKIRALMLDLKKLVRRVEPNLATLGQSTFTKITTTNRSLWVAKKD